MGEELKSTAAKIGKIVPDDGEKYNRPAVIIAAIAAPVIMAVLGVSAGVITSVMAGISSIVIAYINIKGPSGKAKAQTETNNETIS